MPPEVLSCARFYDVLRGPSDGRSEYLLYFWNSGGDSLKGRRIAFKCACELNTGDAAFPLFVCVVSMCCDHRVMPCRKVFRL